MKTSKLLRRETDARDDKRQSVTDVVSRIDIIVVVSFLNARLLAVVNCRSRMIVKHNATLNIVIYCKHLTNHYYYYY